MGPGPKFLNRVGSGQFFVARVGSGQPFMVWVWIWKISPKNVKFFNFFPLGQKISSVRVRKYPGRRRVGLLFTAVQKYARVGSGQGPFLVRIINKKTRAFLLFYSRFEKGLFCLLPYIFWMEWRHFFCNETLWRCWCKDCFILWVQPFVATEKRKLEFVSQRCLWGPIANVKRQF